MLVRLIKWSFLIFVLIIVFASISYPCGPFLPNRILEQDDDYFLKSPEGYFYKEIEQISQTLGLYLKQAESDNNYLDFEAKRFLKTEVADINDLKDALSRSETDSLTTQKTIQAYENARLKVEDLKRKWNRIIISKGSLYDPNRALSPDLSAPDIPDGLPGEFEDYFRAAVFYHQGQFEQARSIWFKLLQRPVKERPYRSTWAAYMIGRVLLDDEPQEAVKWFRFVRKLTKLGYMDSLGLAASSIGWEARAELNQGHYSKAIELYLAQHATGDPSGTLSLQMVCSRVLKADADILKTIALNPLSRKVVTAYIVSRGGPCFDSPSREIIQKWFTAIDGANIDVVEEAGHFAWAAYSMGDMQLAGQWVLKASHVDIMAQWINAKLLLQEGKITDATKQLVKVARIIAPMGYMNEYREHDYPMGLYSSGYPEIKIIRGELGSLFLSQQQYIKALDTFSRGGYWEDAAYIAEHIMKIDEHQNYIDQTWPGNTPEDSTIQMSIDTRLRFLLARRLARLDRWQDARKYYPVKWQNRMDVYVQAIQDGNNQKFLKSKRADALWKAAVIARYEGMELMGTELEPDWFLYDGNEFRRTFMQDIREGKISDTIAPSSTDEIQRTQQIILPDKRFHYRYIATEHAWQAAELMPDNSDQTARVLCIAGSWIKLKDPMAADKFYKALVIRNRKTKLGQEADELRWFPKIEIDGAALLQEVNSQ